MSDKNPAAIVMEENKRANRIDMDNNAKYVSDSIKSAIFHLKRADKAMNKRWSVVPGIVSSSIRILGSVVDLLNRTHNI